MSEKKQESFTVTDRRQFTSEGEIRQEVSHEEVSSTTPMVPPPQDAPSEVASPLQESDTPPAPTASEQQAQEEAYRKSAK